jgi:uncharacterized OB-fold protein
MEAPNRSSRPVPVPTSLTRDYWDGVEAESLKLPYCLDCHTFNYYPHAVCVRCMSTNLEYRPVSGRGTVYTYTVIRSPQPAFKGLEPYVVANVELDEGVRMMANVLTDDVDSIGIGTKVRLVYQEIAPGHKLPQFEPAD